MKIEDAIGAHETYAESQCKLAQRATLPAAVNYGNTIHLHPGKIGATCYLHYVGTNPNREIPDLLTYTHQARPISA